MTVLLSPLNSQHTTLHSASLDDTPITRRRYPPSPSPPPPAVDTHPRSTPLGHRLLRASPNADAAARAHTHTLHLASPFPQLPPLTRHHHSSSGWLNTYTNTTRPAPSPPDTPPRLLTPSRARAPPLPLLTP